MLNFGASKPRVRGGPGPPGPPLDPYLKNNLLLWCSAIVVILDTLQEHKKDLTFVRVSLVSD